MLSTVDTCLTFPMRQKLSNSLRWLPSILWMALIFTGSSDLLSANHTSRFVEPFLRWLFHGMLSAQAIEEGHFLIRKTGHLCEYAALCILFWWALRPPDRRRAVRSILLAAMFAASDEFHQSFVPTRGASIHDVLFDTVGAALGLSLFLGTRRAIRASRDARRQADAGSVPSPPG